MTRLEKVGFVVVLAALIGLIELAFALVFGRGPL